MIYSDFIFVLRWWGILFGLGILFLPLTKLIFENSKDSFYIFSKALGIGILSYAILFLGTFHILPFNVYSLILLLAVSAVVNGYIWKKKQKLKRIRISKIIVFEEVLFFIALLFWSYVRAHEPDIHGLEKFMDFGFVNSILRTDYFPPKDIWFTPFSINYYFFGHLATAVLTKISGISSNITYNLMIATIFAFTLTGGFSLLYNFLWEKGKKYSFLGGILGGFLLALSGNLHTIYAFFSSYTGEHPVPPWALTFLPNLFPNSYWYPNATRFIPFTIHEFPLYSFVVSDLHGHVTDILFVLTTIGLLYNILQNKKVTKAKMVLLSLLLSIMYMTNVWDGIIYLMLTFSVLIVIHSPLLTFHYKKGKGIWGFSKITNLKLFFENLIFEGGIITLLYAFFTLPFSIFFKPFVSGIGVLCAPTFLTNLGKIGPLLFETNHCQHSPFYQLVILYGFFYFFAFCLFIVLGKSIAKRLKHQTKNVTSHIVLPKNMTNIFIVLLILLATLLIIIPELLYAKDIYPQHYRANTMFKLVYQSFILLTLSSAYIIVYLSSSLKSVLGKRLFLVYTFVLLVLVLVYPYFAIKSYYGDLKSYSKSGLDGTSYLKKLYLGDYEAINFLNTHVSGQPVILEAQGDSYTDHARISSNTGLPTVLGWTVHEWLWRGAYSIPAPRIEEVQTMYTGTLDQARPLLKKYKIVYVILGPLEQQKYPAINAEKFNKIGRTIFTSLDKKTKIVKLSVN